MTEAYRMPVHPSELAPGDIWTYRCLNCELVLQGGWTGVLAHFAVVHPERNAPTRPTLPEQPEPPTRTLTAIPGQRHPTTPPRTPKARTRPHSPVQEALFDLSPQEP